MRHQQVRGASASPPGSRPSDGAQEVSTLSGFDPSRGEIGELTVIYATGWNAAIKHCAGIAERWRDQNIVQRTRARKSGRRRYDFDGDETMLVMAEQLDGAAAECDAIAVEIRAQAIATEAHRAETTKIGSVHEGAGPQDIAPKDPS